MVAFDASVAGQDLHFDPFSGLAGDMFLGACLDLGTPLALLEEVVSALGLEGVTVEQRRARRGGLEGVRFRVCLDGAPVEGPDPEEAAAGGGPVAPVRRGSTRLTEILDRIAAGGLDGRVRDLATQLFERLGRAEAAVHGCSLDDVHFHEVGAVDALVDIVGAAAVWCELDPRLATCGPVNVGSGTVKTAHGVLPVPAPATAELLVDRVIYGEGDGELTTPTGALLASVLARPCAQLPRIELAGVGIGLGRREVEGRPNAFRLLCGRAGAADEQIMLVETNVDDVAGEVLGHLMDGLLAGPALDVFFTPIQMKKSRPGTRISVLCRQTDGEAVAATVMAETGSLGCRTTPVGRLEAERRWIDVETEFGSVRFKEGRLRGRRISLSPEYEDCRRLAAEHSVRLADVLAAAYAAASKLRES